MNNWTQKSIVLANAPGYLDSLAQIYVMNVNPERPLTQDLEKNIRLAFKKRNTRALIRFLLKTDVFPVKDSYIGFLRRKPQAVDENPQSIKRIGNRLYSMGIDALIREASRPKETNRQLGQSFKNWLPKLGYPVLSETEFSKAKGIAILAGNDATLARYAKEKLGSTLTKGIDLVLKKNNHFLLAETKFLTTPGGEQNGGFVDASTFIANAHEKKATRVALLDGYIWLKSKGGLHGKIIGNSLDIFSALLLPDYIKKF